MESTGLKGGKQKTAYSNQVMPWIPDMDDVLRASEVIARWIPRSPLIHLPALSETFGVNFWLKAEAVLPTGSFKVRGGINLMSLLPEHLKQRGVVTASTGNHGQSIAFAASKAGVRATIFVPEGGNPLKVASMRRMGAEVVFAGRDFAESCDAMDAFAAREGAYLIHPANEPALIAGVATYTREVLEDKPDTDVMFVPIGGGSGVSGASIVAEAMKPDLRLYGVQAAGAPAVYESRKSGRLLKLDRMQTFAEGVATREAFDLPSKIFWSRVDEIVLVTDTDMKRSMLTIMEQGRIVAEGAGAAALAAAVSMRDQLQGMTVVCVASGGNVTMDSIKQIVNEEQPW